MWMTGLRDGVWEVVISPCSPASSPSVTIGRGKSTGYLCNTSPQGRIRAAEFLQAWSQMLPCTITHVSMNTSVRNLLLRSASLLAAVGGPPVLWFSETTYFSTGTKDEQRFKYNPNVTWWRRQPVCLIGQNCVQRSEPGSVAGGLEVMLTETPPACPTSALLEGFPYTYRLIRSSSCLITVDSVVCIRAHSHE